MSYPLLLIRFGALLIAGEVDSGSMLILVSKPIPRLGIFSAKFLAYIIYGLLLSLIPLVVITATTVVLHPLGGVLPFFCLNFVYSLFLLFFFGISIVSLSAIVRKPRNALVFPIFLIVFLNFVMLFFKPFLLRKPLDNDSTIYGDYLIYYFDLSYHLANIFKGLAEPLILGIRTNIGPILQVYGVYRMDIGEIPIVDTNYLNPLTSFIILTIFALGLLVIGLLRFILREI
ncbi:MAG: ABC transporter permease subunit [Candidatus Lokiarchaeota archaeon]